MDADVKDVHLFQGGTMDEPEEMSEPEQASEESIHSPQTEGLDLRSDTRGSQFQENPDPDDDKWSRYAG